MIKPLIIVFIKSPDYFLAYFYAVGGLVDYVDEGGLFIYL